MTEALAVAGEAGERGEVPVGAVVVHDGRELSRAGNVSVSEHDPTGHAEVVALRTAARAVRNYRLIGATLYVTVEPCLMCVGAALHARINRLVYGCRDPKSGAAGSLFDATCDPRLNHHITVVAGVEEAACRSLLQHFFRMRRGARTAP